MSTVAPPAVLFERVSEHIALVTLNRPEARNAVNGEVARGLEAIVRQTEADDTIWAVVLTGAGGQAFSAGADLKEISSGNGASLATADGGFAGFVFQKRSKLWIAAVDGFALAGGCEIALTCDMIVASERSQFGLPEVKRGLSAAAGGLFRLPRVLPRAVALEMIATGDPITAQRAHHFGMVNHVVPAGQAKDAALKIAATVCANAPISVRESLGVARQAFDHDETALFRISREAQTRLYATEDFKEGPRAFVEKRPPRWTGR